MTAQVIPFPRAILLQQKVVIVPQNRNTKSDDLLAYAGDVSLADKLRAAGEAVCKHLDKTKKPLLPEDRARLMRAIGVLRGEPQ